MVFFVVPVFGFLLDVMYNAYNQVGITSSPLMLMTSSVVAIAVTLS
jgi:hypothetical protein